MIASPAVTALLAAALLQQGGGVITGTVRDAEDGASSPLPYALVEVPGSAGVLADSAGHYTLRDVRAGRRLVRVIHVGYAPLEVEVLVPSGGRVVVDVGLERKPIPMPAVVVRVEPVQVSNPRPPVPETELAVVAVRALEATTGMAEAGIGEAARSLAGSDPPDPTDVLFMRGSTADLKLLLLDGAPVYAPFHMAGLIQAFDPSALGAASLYLGGAPARYDGGLSYILDLETRTPRSDGVHGSAAVDLVSARGSVDGSLGSRAGFLAAARGLHGFHERVLAEGRSPYGYADALARVHVDLGEGHRLRGTAFWNDESVFLDLPSGGGGGAVNVTDAEDASWGNRAGSLTYSGRMGETAAEFTAAWSRYRARLPLSGSTPMFARGDSRRDRLTGDFSRPLGRGILRFGGNVDRLDLRYAATSLDPSQVREVRTHAQGSVVGAYVEGDWPLAPSVRGRGGLRVDRFSTTGGGLRLSPRLDLTWLLTEDAALTLAAGSYHQYGGAPSQEVGDVLTSVTGGGTAMPGLLPVASASHLLVSLDQRLDRGIKLDLEGFVKRFAGLSDTAGEDRLNASGLDLRVLKEADRLTGWLGYSLTWFWQPDGDGGGTSDFTGQHLLSAGLMGRVSDRVGFDLRLGFGDGLPYTAVPIGESLANEALPGRGQFEQVTNVDSGAGLAPVAPDDAFFRVDAELFGVLEPEFTGRRTRLRPYLRLLNALDRRDALFYYFEPWREDAVRPLAELSIVPVAGIEWTF